MSRAKCRATLVVNNQARGNLQSEHGLAIWIEAYGHRLLFDTAAGEAVIENAIKLNIDLSQVDFIVLSHGHYDHTGGLSRVLKIATSAKVVLHPDAVTPKYGISTHGKVREIGMPTQARGAIAGLDEERIIWATGRILIGEHIGVATDIPRKTSFEDTGGNFYLDPEGFRKDPIADDLSLFIDTPHGLVVFVGCSHAGLINILNYLRSFTDRVHAIMGGFHLINADNERLKESLGSLEELSPQIIIPCHCTGKRAVTILRQSLGDRVKPCLAGMEYHF